MKDSSTGTTIEKKDVGGECQAEGPSEKVPYTPTSGVAGILDKPTVFLEKARVVDIGSVSPTKHQSRRNKHPLNNGLPSTPAFPCARLERLRLCCTRF